MRFRKLRLAWSVFWGLACVLLIVLWVRSYSFCDNWTRLGASAPMRLDIQSWRGRTVLVVIPAGTLSRAGMHCWKWHTIEAEEWERKRADAAGLGTLVAPPKFISISVTSEVCSAWVTDWLLVLVSAAFGFLPWISVVAWCRQFSLRTLLIATTLVAVVLGLIAWH